MLWSKPPVIRDDDYYDGDKGGYKEHADHRRPYAMMRTGGDDVAHSNVYMIGTQWRQV